MTPERIEELNLLTIPPPALKAESEMSSKEKTDRKIFVFKFKTAQIRIGIRSLFPFTQINYCRKQNGNLTWSFIVFNGNVNYRILFMDTNELELGTMASFIEEKINPGPSLKSIGE